MQKRVGILYFSPTGTTKKICEAIASGMGAKNAQLINITFPENRSIVISHPDKYSDSIEHLIIGAPVYIGKLPLQVIECLKVINGKGRNCTCVVVYGNRDYGIALRTMVDLLSANNFNVIAVSAFIGQHSYKDIIPVAIGRPDKLDLDLANAFGKESIGVSKTLPIDKIPVQIDMFSKSKSYFPLKPVFDSNKCNQCGDCAETCPMGIISPDTGNFFSKKAKQECVGCMACVSNCTNSARIADANFLMKLFIRRVLRRASVTRLDPLTIFA